ncbi:MAG TPA: 3-isopropylmalate dehydrogenase [bacterium]|nr:3-isopropylmalate dehydrogenase [bacterium]HPN35286.1 3-isopropylmalate dehydrogenase [bacterium]
MKKERYTIAVLPGDGIGPEVMAEALKVLQAVALKNRFQVQLNQADVGGVAIEKFNTPLPASTLQTCRQADAVLLAAIGHPRYDSLPSDKRPEKGLLGLRAELGLYANLRPAKIYPSLIGASTLKEEVVRDIDLLIVRELTGGLYFGEPRGLQQEMGFNTMVYRRHEVERIAQTAFEAAARRGKKVTSVDKANVLEVSQFWRKIVLQVAARYPDIALDHYYVDNCAMQLVRNPRQFDVILTENLFGDILSDEASMLTGSLGMLPSASLGTGSAMYEPVHGSAPDIAGKNIANPIAMIASVAMMLRYSFDRSQEAEGVETAISRVLEAGYRTRDIAAEGDRVVSTSEMGALITEAL